MPFAPADRARTPLGVILAGGASRRFGAPKALALVGGRRIVERVRDALAAAADEIAVSANDPALFADLGLPILADEAPDLGPLGGIQAALRHAAAGGYGGALVVACDLPHVSAGLLRTIAERAATSAADAVVPESAGRRAVEPLCAWYSVRCLDEIGRMLAEGERRAHRLAERIRIDRIPLAEVRRIGDPHLLFHNVNTVTDLHEAQHSLGVPPVVSIIGRKNSGKTRLVVALLREMRSRGFRVASIKHGHHGFESDEKGRDSWKHFNEGQAEATLMVGTGKMALVMRTEGEADPQRLVRDFLAGRGYHLVLVEGYKKGPFPKIEIWRRDEHDHPLYEEFGEQEQHYLAIVTDDDAFRANIPVVLLDDDDTPSHVKRLCDMLANLCIGHNPYVG